MRVFVANGYYNLATPQSRRWLADELRTFIGEDAPVS